MSKTCDKGEPDDECAACKAPIPAKDPIYCSRCVTGNDEEALFEFQFRGDGDGSDEGAELAEHEAEAEPDADPHDDEVF